MALAGANGGERGEGMPPDVRAAWTAYRALSSLAVRVVLEPVWRLRRRSSELEERLGRGTPPLRAPGPRIVVHAVSVGEVAVAHALLHELGRAAPEARFLLTSGTRDGRRAAERLSEGSRERLEPSVEGVAYLPWDRPRVVEDWVARLAPSAVVVVETEIWPGLFRACRELGVPLAVVNGRFSPGDVGRYRLARRFFADVLSGASWIGVQSDEEREGFLSIGAPADRVEVTGNLKFDVPTGAQELPAWWTKGRPEGPLVVAGSTHAPEERWLLGALRALSAKIPSVRLVLAPRDTRRARSIAAEAGRRGFRAALSSSRSGASRDVLVLDEMGILAPLYGEADAVFVGGSLVPKGGQNPLEAAARGRAVVVGPHVESFRDVVRLLEEAGGLVRLAGGSDPASELAAVLGNFLTDRELARRAGEAARAVVRGGRGASRKSALAILGLLHTETAPSEPGTRRAARVP